MSLEFRKKRSLEDRFGGDENRWREAADKISTYENYLRTVSHPRPHRPRRPGRYADRRLVWLQGEGGIVKVRSGGNLHPEESKCWNLPHIGY